MTSEEDRWVDAMMQLEHGFAPAEERPLAAALATFVAFVVVGFVPLAPFVVATATSFEAPSPYVLSTILTGAAFVAVGVARAKVVGTNPWRSAAVTFGIGGVAAAVAFGVGAALGGLA